MPSLNVQVARLRERSKSQGETVALYTYTNPRSPSHHGHQVAEQLDGLDLPDLVLARHRSFGSCRTLRGPRITIPCAMRYTDRHCSRHMSSISNCQLQLMVINMCFVEHMGPSPRPLPVRSMIIANSCGGLWSMRGGIPLRVSMAQLLVDMWP